VGYQRGRSSRPHRLTPSPVSLLRRLDPLPSISEELRLSYTQLGSMIGLANVLGSLLQMVYSVACRKVSRLLLCGFNFFMSLGCLLTGIANRFEVVVTGNAVAGVGSGGTPRQKLHPLQ